MRQLGLSIVVVLVTALVPPAGARRFLDEIQTVPDGGGLERARGVSVSPDDRFVYVASEGENAISIFARDLGTGALTHTGTVTQGFGGVEGLSSVRTLGMSLDGAHLYSAALYEGAGSVGLVRFARDDITGALTWLGIDDLLDRAAQLAFSAGGQNVYLTHDHGTFPHLFVYDRDPGTGLLTFIQIVSAFTVYSSPFVPELLYPVGVAVSPDGAHVYVTGHTTGRIVVFARNAITGTVSLLETIADPEMSSPNRLAMSADGAHLYVASYGGGGKVLAFARTPATGHLTLLDVEQQGVGGVSGLGGAYDLELSADGDHLYVRGTGQLAVFARAMDGTLAFVEAHADDAGGVDGLGTEGDIALSADGATLYGAGDADDAIAVFDRTPATGELAFQAMVRKVGPGPDGFGGATMPAVSPDGTSVYVTGRTDDAVAVFDRDVASGLLTYVEHERDGLGGADGLAGASGVTVSPDGAHVYTTASVEHAVGIFERDPGTGALTPSGVARNGVGGVTGLVSPQAVAVSPDGNHVYVAGNGPGSVSAFVRTPGTGALGFVETEQDGVGGVGGLAGASAVVVTSDGALVYVLGRSDGFLVVFARDAGTGALSLIEERSLGGPSPSVALGLAADGQTPLVGEVMTPDGTLSVRAGLFGFQDEPEAFLQDPLKRTTRRLEVATGSALGWLALSPDGRTLYATALGPGPSDDLLRVVAVSPCSPTLLQSRLTITKISSGGFGDEIMRLTARFLPRGYAFADLDPIADGAGVTLYAPSDAPFFDVVLPGGAYAGAGTRGWKGNAAGTVWTYRDTTATPLGGIVKLVLKVRTTSSGEAVGLKLSGRRGNYPAINANFAPQAVVSLGAADRCAATPFAGGGAFLDCAIRGVLEGVVCRQR